MHKRYRGFNGRVSGLGLVVPPPPLGPGSGPGLYTAAGGAYVPPPTVSVPPTSSYVAPVVQPSGSNGGILPSQPPSGSAAGLFQPDVTDFWINPQRGSGGSGTSIGPKGSGPSAADVDAAIMAAETAPGKAGESTAFRIGSEKAGDKATPEQKKKAGLALALITALTLLL